MRKILRRLLPTLLAGLFMAAPSIIARGQQPNQAGPRGKKIKGVHRLEVQSQRRRLKQTGKSNREEALQSGHRGTAPKGMRHQMRKVQRKANPKSMEQRGARRQNRSRKKTPPLSQAN